MVRGLLLFLIGIILGAALMLAWWPHLPAGVTAPRSSDVRIFLSDDYLARVAARRVDNLQVPRVSNVRIASNPPTSLIVRCDLSVGPLSTPAALELAPATENGQIQTRLIAGDVAGIPIPGQLTSVVADVVNQQLTNLPGSGVRATGVRIIPGGLEIVASYP